MILVGGLENTEVELPFTDMVEYMVENDKTKLGIKLKTVAKSANCMAVYLHNSLLDLKVDPSIDEKLTYFNDEEHLIMLLMDIDENTSDKADSEESEPVVEIPDFLEGVEDTEVYTDAEPKPVEVLELEEVSINDESFFEIPNATDDKDVLRVQLSTKDRIIEQKDTSIRDLRETIEEMYKLHEVQLLEMKDTYEEQMAKIGETLQEYQDRAESNDFSEEDKVLLKYLPYMRTPKAALKEGFSEDELKRLGKITSQITTVVGASGDSVYSTLKGVHSLIKGGTKALVVDMSGDAFLKAHLRWATQDSFLHLNKPEVTVESLVKDVNGVKLIPTDYYNDLALLGFDWIDILKKLMKYAGGRPILFVFNNITSSPVRYTVSKLSTLGKLFVVVNSNPINMVALSGYVGTIPNDRVTLVATNYFEGVKSFLERYDKSYRVIVCKEDIDWSKLKVSL